MDPILQFEEESRNRIEAYGRDQQFQKLSLGWLEMSMRRQYVYNFHCMGRPIIQYPQDMIAMQELIWQVRPDLIIETGIAHGGSLIMSASILAMLDYCDAVDAGTLLDPRTTSRRVLGLDIDIRAHNRAAIQAHPMAHRIDMIQGSSVEPEVIAQVHEIAKGHKKILLCLDSNHTYEHALAELEAFAPLVSKGSYCCVFDTLIEDLPDDMYPDRPWSKGNNPKTAVWEYLRRLKDEGRKAIDGDVLDFEMDKTIEYKLLITAAPSGYLKRV